MLSECDVFYGFHRVLLGLFDHRCLPAVTGSGPCTQIRTGAEPVGKDVLSARLLLLCSSDDVDLALYDDAL